MMPKIFFIIGPKCSGKTALGGGLAERTNMKKNWISSRREVIGLKAVVEIDSAGHLGRAVALGFGDHRPDEEVVVQALAGTSRPTAPPARCRPNRYCVDGPLTSPQSMPA